MLAKKTLTNIDKKSITVNTDWKPLLDVNQKILLIDID